MVARSLRSAQGPPSATEWEAGSRLPVQELNTTGSLGDLPYRNRPSCPLCSFSLSEPGTVPPGQSVTDFFTLKRTGLTCTDGAGRSDALIPVQGRDVAPPTQEERTLCLTQDDAQSLSVLIPSSHLSLCSSQTARSIPPVLGFPISTPLLLVLPYPLGLKSTRLPSPAQTSLFQKGFPDDPSWDDCSFSDTLSQHTGSPPPLAPSMPCL